MLHIAVLESTLRLIIPYNVMHVLDLHLSLKSEFLLYLLVLVTAIQEMKGMFSAILHKITHGNDIWTLIYFMFRF